LDTEKPIVRVSAVHGLDVAASAVPPYEQIRAQVAEQARALFASLDLATLDPDTPLSPEAELPG